MASNQLRKDPSEMVSLTKFDLTTQLVNARLYFLLNIGYVGLLASALIKNIIFLDSSFLCFRLQHFISVIDNTLHWPWSAALWKPLRRKDYTIEPYTYHTVSVIKDNGLYLSSSKTHSMSRPMTSISVTSNPFERSILVICVFK